MSDLNNFYTDYVNSYERPVHHIDHNGVELDVQETLSFNDALAFGADIVSSCIDQSSSTYTPEALDFAVRAGVMEYYAGIPMTDDHESAYRVLYESDWFDTVYEQINQVQLRTIVEQAKKRIEYMKSIFTSTASAQFADVIRQIQSIFDDGKSLIGELSSDKTLDLLEKYTGLVGGTSDESKTDKPAPYTEVSIENILPMKNSRRSRKKKTPNAPAVV